MSSVKYIASNSRVIVNDVKWRIYCLF